MKKFFKNLLLLTLPSLLVLYLILEFLVFRLILPANQIPHLTMDKEYLVKRFDPEGPHSGYFSMGRWARPKTRWRLNNRGWMSHIDYDTTKKRKRIAVIGDSFVMPAVVNTEEGFAQQLHELMKDSVDVYSFGVGSTPLSNYLQMARLVEDRYDPDFYIVNIVYNDFLNSLAVKAKDRFWRYAVDPDSTVRLIPPVYSSTGNYSLLQRSAIFRYLRSNLGLANFSLNKKKVENRYEENVDKKNVSAFKKEIRLVTHHILQEFRQLFPNKRLLFTMDAPREMIYKNTLDKSKVSWLNDLMAEACATHQIEFIDLTPHFLADYQQHHKRFEHEGNRHWNAYGHRLVASVILQQIQSPSSLSDEQSSY